MKNRKTVTLTLIGLFIFLFSIVGLTYAYWSRTLTQTGENLVYTDCLKLEVNWGTEGFTLNDAYPMTNKELVSDFFPKQTPYHFTITNNCEEEVPISINMESLTPEEEIVLKDEYVDVILWEDENTDYFDSENDQVLSSVGSRKEFDSDTEVPSYKLIDNKVNDDKILTEANKAYQLHTFKLGAGQAKQFSLLLFMDYATPVSTDEEQTNNAHWRGKITLNNYEIPKVKIAGIDVELAEDGNGLYQVTHDDFTSVNEEEILASALSEWQAAEYRYAGPNPDNYVTFNEELWRIIGLVNVKTKSGDIVQRLKIIRKDPIKANDNGFSWDYKTNGIGSSIGDYGSNDWTDSQLMEMLNGIYYNSESGNCYQGSSTVSTCDFTQSSSGVKGLNSTAQGMIDKDIIWNIGGSSTYNDLTVSMFYERERGTYVFTSGLPFPRETEWKSSNTGKASLETTNQKVLDSELTLFQSVALPYPSDYGYATSGGTLGREECFKEVLHNLESASNYQTQCGKNNWLKPASGWMWTLSPYSYDALFAFWVDSSGCVGYGNVGDSDTVYPTLYLSSSVKLSSGTADSESPLGSEQNPFTLIME